MTLAELYSFAAFFGTLLLVCVIAMLVILFCACTVIDLYRFVKRTYRRARVRLRRYRRRRRDAEDFARAREVVR